MLAAFFLMVFLLGLLSDFEDGGNILLRNVSQLLPDFTASHPRRKWS
jgi:hypothetical protein